MAGKYITFNMKIPKTINKEIEELIEYGYFFKKTEFIRFCINKTLLEYHKVLKDKS